MIHPTNNFAQNPTLIEVMKSAPVAVSFRNRYPGWDISHPMAPTTPSWKTDSA